MAEELIVVDWTEPRKAIVEFLCQIYNIPPTVPYWENDKIRHYYKLITNYTVLNINNRSKFLANINNGCFIEELLEEDKDIFYNKISNLQELLLYLLYYLSGYLQQSDDNIYILRDMNYDCIIISFHILNKEADTLVFNQ